MNDLVRTWERIHGWLAVNCPIVLASFGPPATEEQFEVAEQAMGVKFPEEVKAVYRIHDRQRVIPTPVSYWPDLRCVPAFLHGEEWFDLEGMIERWQSMRNLLDGGTFKGIKGSPRGPVRTNWWHPGWLPLTEDGSGYMRCLDLAPKSRGHAGQVIFWCHDSAERGVLAPSLPVWLERFAVALEQGESTSVPDKHGPGLIRVRDV